MSTANLMAASSPENLAANTDKVAGRIESEREP
jgi:hypothetical protein